MKRPNDQAVLLDHGSGTLRSAASAKFRLLSWARRHDVRARKSGFRIGPLIAAGVAASLGGVLLARGVSARRQSAGRSSPKAGVARKLVVGAAMIGLRMWLIPAVAAALQRRSQRQPP
jgi:hypothetical protein